MFTRRLVEIENSIKELESLIEETERLIEISRKTYLESRIEVLAFEVRA